MSNSIADINVRKRTINDSFSSPQRKKNKTKKSKQYDCTSSSDSQSDEDNCTKTMELIKTPTFNGRRLVSDGNTDSKISISTDKDNWFHSMEKKYLMPLLLGQEKLEMIMKSLHKNQINIQKALKKQQVRYKNILPYKYSKLAIKYLSMATMSFLEVKLACVF